MISYVTTYFSIITLHAFNIHVGKLNFFVPCSTPFYMHENYTKYYVLAKKLNTACTQLNVCMQSHIQQGSIILAF